MKTPRRAVKLKTTTRRAKPDTSRKLTAHPSGFVRNEWLETLSRVKADQPRRYAKEVSPGLKVTVSKYEELREAHGRQQSARAEKGRVPEADDPPTAKPGSGMLLIPTCPADPLRLAVEQVEGLRRERPPLPVKTDKKKSKRRGAIGAPRFRNRKVLSGDSN